jgi:hypothetical protein
MSSSNSDDENTDNTNKIVKKEITIITWGNKKRKCCPVRVHKNWNVTGISDKKPKHLDLAHLNGKNEEMQKYISQQNQFDTYVATIMKFVTEAFNKNQQISTLFIGINCHKGRHRSVATAEILAKKLRDLNYQVNINHAEL